MDDMSSVTSVCIILVRVVQISGWVGGSQEIQTLFRFQKYVNFYGSSLRELSFIYQEGCHLFGGDKIFLGWLKGKDSFHSVGQRGPQWFEGQRGVDQIF